MRCQVPFVSSGHFECIDKDCAQAQIKPAKKFTVDFCLQSSLLLFVKFLKVFSKLKQQKC